METEKTPPVFDRGRTADIKGGRKGIKRKRIKEGRGGGDMHGGNVSLIDGPLRKEEIEEG